MIGDVGVSKPALLHGFSHHGRVHCLIEVERAGCLWHGHFGDCGNPPPRSPSLRASSRERSLRGPQGGAGLGRPASGEAHLRAGSVNFTASMFSTWCGCRCRMPPRARMWCVARTIGGADCRRWLPHSSAECFSGPPACYKIACDTSPLASSGALSCLMGSSERADAFPSICCMCVVYQPPW